MLLDKMYRYEMDATRTLGATERTRNAKRTDGPWSVLLALISFIGLINFSKAVTIDLFHKSHNVTVPYPTMHHQEQKCAHICSEWCMVDMEQVHCGRICETGLWTSHSSSSRPNIWGIFCEFKIQYMMSPAKFWFENHISEYKWRTSVVSWNI